jgi:outer membrane protein
MKFRKVLLLSGLGVLVWCASHAQPQARIYSLRQCVETGIANNLTVNRSRLNMDRSEVYMKQSRGNMLPTLQGSIDHNLNSGRSIDLLTNDYVNQEYTIYGLQTGVTLFNGLRLLNILRSDQYAYEAGKMEWQQQKDNLTLDIILAYLQILTSQDQLELARIQTEQTRKQVERLEILNNQGAIMPSDLTDMKGQLANNILAEINTANALETAKLNLAQLMNIPYDSNFTVERLTVDQFDLQYAATPDSIFAIASEQLAMVRATELRRKSAEKSVAAARGNYFPSIGLGANIFTNFSSTGRDSSNAKIPYYDQLSNNYRTTVGIGISIPILNGFRTRNQVNLAKIDLKEAELTEESTRIQLRQAIERDYVNMVAARKRYQALVEQVDAMIESFRAAEARFNAGVGNSIDYLTARNRLDLANINLIQARYDYVLRTKILDYYQGRPLW